MLEYALLLIFPLAMAYAGAMDFFTMTIPNRISLALIAGFVVVAAVSRPSLAALQGHVGAGALMLVVGIGMFALGWLGGGDAKIMAAASLWIGFDHLLPYLLYVAVCGGVLSLLILAYRGLPLPATLYGQPWATRLHDKEGGIPYGIALAAAGLWVYPSTKWFFGLGLGAGVVA